MISKAIKDVEKFLKDKEELYYKVDDLNKKYRSYLVGTLIKMISEINSKIRQGTPNGTDLITLYTYKDAPPDNWDKFNDIRDISNVKLLKGGMDLIELDLRLISVENKHITFRYSYRNVDNMHIYLNKDESDIDLAILIHVVRHFLKHPFFVDNNLKYLKKLNEYKDKHK